MPIEVGSLTIIDTNGEEARTAEPLNRLPAGAWRNVTSYLYRRVMEHGDHITIYAPTDEHLARWYDDIRDNKPATLIMKAEINGDPGGISIAAGIAGTEPYWQVFSHTVTPAKEEAS